MAFVPLFPGLPGGIEIFVVLLIVVLLFGANKLPKLARSSGQAMGEFKKGREQIEQELQEMKGENEGESGTAGAQNAETNAFTENPNAPETTAAEPDTGTTTGAGTTTNANTETTTDPETEKQN